MMVPHTKQRCPNHRRPECVTDWAGEVLERDCRIFKGWHSRYDTVTVFDAVEIRGWVTREKIPAWDYKTVTVGVPKFFADKFARLSAKNWDKFYKRNNTNFFRDRHWTTRSETDGFPCLMEKRADDSSPIVIVEAGCGVANCAFPLLVQNEQLYIFMFDFAQSAISLVKAATDYNPERCHVFLWDFSREPFSTVTDPGCLSTGSADYCLLIFVLSAVPPELQLTALGALHGLLKEGGRILFRDYAVGDMAQSRFANSNKIDENFFVRQDSTLAYFFDETRLDALMTQAGFVKVYCRRINRLIKNRKEGLHMERIFLQAEYAKQSK